MIVKTAIHITLPHFALKCVFQADTETDQFYRMKVSIIDTERVFAGRSGGVIVVNGAVLSIQQVEYLLLYCPVFVEGIAQHCGHFASGRSIWLSADKGIIISMQQFTFFNHANPSRIHAVSPVWLHMPVINKEYFLSLLRLFFKNLDGK